jgi:hypothetical protein
MTKKQVAWAVFHRDGVGTPISVYKTKRKARSLANEYEEDLAEVPRCYLVRGTVVRGRFVPDKTRKAK